MMLHQMQNTGGCWLNEEKMGRTFTRVEERKLAGKAEEKRQARIERELLEEEERKQREDVARLVEERRRQRGEKMEVEKDHGRGSTADREKDSKKEAEKRRQERRKEKDKWSSKSNSDAEELEKRAGKEGERKREFDRKSDTDRREHHRTSTEISKNHTTEMGNGVKGAVANNHSQGNAGTRYLDRMRGTFLSSSKAFSGGKNYLSLGNQLLNGDDKTTNRPKFKTLLLLVTLLLDNHMITPLILDCHRHFTLPTFPSIATTSSTVFPLTSEAMFPRIREAHRDYLPEESDIFEDPCYVPDPVSLLGPVSESLDNFQLDHGVGFAMDMGLEPRPLKNISAAAVNRPSPIESPMSRIRVADERHSISNRFPSTPLAHDVLTSPRDGSNSGNENGMWQMWSTSPLGQDGIGLVGGPASWLLPPETKKLNMDDMVHPMSQKTMASLFTKDNQGRSGSNSPQKVFLGNCQNGGGFATSVPGSIDDPWLPKTLFGQMPGSEGHFAFNPQEETSQNEMMYGSSSSSATNRPFEFSPPNCWAKKEWAAQGSGEGIENSPPIPRPHVGGLYSTPDVQSLWSYD
ncbi:hypothetical protein Acr_03g0006050 [Actinidia rufa]|uniref:Uncharacterized protein n=1 Tax=Actinidia rufa TaxID=165716 RepID=A0A7J0EBF6_9ERIC|nr:hypothetical protein Acr_03g0006050 [Actinidia rufa]